MRIAFVVGWVGGGDTGPFKKIAEQTAQWQRQGCEVGVFVLTETKSLSDWSAVPGVLEMFGRSSRPLALAKQKEVLIGAAVRWAPDVLYHRYSLPYRGLLLAGRRTALVLEINTDDVAEYDLLSPLKGRVNRLMRGHVLRGASGFAFVTRELAESRRFTRYRKPSVVVANGVRLEQIASAPPAHNKRPRLVFLGQPRCAWHGIDKLLWLAEQRPQWDFDLVGPESRDVGRSLPNLVAHGVLPARDYAKVLARADVAVGSLAMHRTKINEASTLKLREYLATGLPTIVGYSDTDFPEPVPFLLQLPNNASNVVDRLRDIDAFVAAWQGRRVERASIGHLDTEDKEAARLQFFAEVVAARAR